MRINNNLMAMNTHRQLGINADNGAKSIEKLSSGFRINRAGDDAAGLAISEKMRAQIRGLGQASRNAQDSISLVQTAEGAMNEAQAILQRMRELAVQSANDTNVDADRGALQNEINQLATELTRIANDTEFNERTLLNGGLQEANLGELTFHIGANAAQNVRLDVGAIDAKTLGVSRDVNVGTLDDTNAAGVQSVNVDEVAVQNAVGVGEYFVEVAEQAAGHTTSELTVGTDTDIGTGFLNGLANADTEFTLTYNDEIAGVNATIAATQVGGSGDTLAFEFDDPTARANDISIVFDVANDLGATWDSTTNTITITLSTDTQTNNIATNIASEIQGLGSVQMADGDNIDLSNISVAGQGDFANATGVDSDDLVTSLTLTFSGGEDTIAEGWTASAGAGEEAGHYGLSDTFTVNGINVDLDKLTGSTDGDVVTVIGYENAVFTAQLLDDNEDAIGETVVIDVAAGGTYTIGDADAAGVMEVTFAAGAASAGTTTVTVATELSTAASFEDGVTTEARAQAGLNITTQTSADAAITVINAAITQVSDERAKLGAVQNRLEHTIKNLDTSAENLQASESRIRDVDMAQEMMEFTKNNILSQAAQAMLAQANQAPQGVLQLLR